jgi:NTE family protein
MYRSDRALILSGGGARGAYEIGVWKRLCEMNWRPDLICGTSVGAINGAAITAGSPLEDLITLWASIERNTIYRVSIYRRIVNSILRRGFTSYMDTKPLRSFLESTLDVEKIRTSDVELVISAVNVLSSEIEYFNNNSIGIDHIMASSALPILFPWQYIGDKPYWDGGVMANTPIAPALERQVPEIIVVLLSPMGGAELPLPKNQKEAVERMFEHTQIGSFEAFRFNISQEHGGAAHKDSPLRGASAPKNMRIVTVAPKSMLGFRSVMDFSPKRSDELIHAGYEDAKVQLADFFGPI